MHAGQVAASGMMPRVRCRQQTLHLCFANAVKYFTTAVKWKRTCSTVCGLLYGTVRARCPRVQRFSGGDPRLTPGHLCGWARRRPILVCPCLCRDPADTSHTVGAHCRSITPEARAARWVYARGPGLCYEPKHLLSLPSSVCPPSDRVQGFVGRLSSCECQRLPPAPILLSEWARLAFTLVCRAQPVHIGAQCVYGTRMPHMGNTDWAC